MKEEKTAQMSSYAQWRVYYAWTLLFLLYIFDYADRMIIVSLYPFLKAEWGLTDAQCGLFMSAVSWAEVLFAFPIATLIDRWSRTKGIGIMAIVWSLATAAGAFTRNFTQLFVTRCVVGLGEAGYSSGGIALISAITKPEKRARWLGFWQAGIPLGQAMGILLGGWIAVHYGWRNALGVVALPGLVVAIMFFWVRDYKTIELTKSVSKQETRARVKMGKLDVLKELFRSKALILNNLGSAAFMFVVTAVVTWLSAYLQRFSGMSIKQSSLMVAGLLIVAFVGAPLGGHFTDQMLKTRANARMLFPAICASAATVILAVGLSFFKGSVLYVFIAASAFFTMMCLPGTLAVTQDLVHPGLRTSSRSVTVIYQTLLGGALGPLVVGALSDAFGLDKAFLILPAVYALSAALFFWGSLYYKKDLDECEKCEIVFENS
jgi:predicted MFS family arabinose efflux permease